ncbi:hypothetical protein DKM44_02725 [Deinococcus irradiatisoli]|uniref:Uncharacterized protein n=1 Tax=Deinococcus irradiatisoli TaxID=2202254 RepID=A0A2Z3JM09_9DEIO|nr:hypothetical protein [Deinococcus irradiatisoli]AWN22284.1 hypothetical protein DKM44_02725 [Deinococcus irradiatisoli]
MKRFSLVLLVPAFLLSACGQVTAPAPLANAVTKAELRLSAQLLMPLLSAATVQLAAHDFSRPLLPVDPGGEALAPQALSCGTNTIGGVDADQDKIPASASAQLSCSYTDEDDESASTLQLSGSMTVTDKDDQDPGAGLTSRAALSGTAQTRYKGTSASLSAQTQAEAFLDPTPGQNGYGGGLNFVTSSVGSGQAFGVSSSVTLSRALSAQLRLVPDINNQGGQLSLTGQLSNRNDLSHKSSDLQLSGSLHAAQGDCKAADSGSVVFSKGAVSLTASVTGCGVYSYQ